jgi:protein TonB
MRLALPMALVLHAAVLAAVLAWPPGTPLEPDEPPAMQVELAAVVGAGQGRVSVPESAPQPQPPQPPQVEAPPPQPPAPEIPSEPPRAAAPAPPLPPLPPVAEEPAMLAPPPPPPPPQVAQPAPRPPERKPPPERTAPRPPAPRQAPPTTRPVLPLPPAADAAPAFTAALVPDRVAQAAYTPAAPYPPEARNRGQQGLVVVRIDIGPDGHVTRVTLMQSSGVPALDRSVLETIPRWRFDPARRNGRPVADAILQRVVFSLY